MKEGNLVCFDSWAMSAQAEQSVEGFWFKAMNNATRMPMSILFLQREFGVLTAAWQSFPPDEESRQTGQCPLATPELEIGLMTTPHHRLVLS